MNAIHARSQLRYSPTAIDLEIRENPCETTVMLTWPSRDSQENGAGQAQSSLMLDERAGKKSLSVASTIIEWFGDALTTIEDERRRKKRREN